MQYFVLIIYLKRFSLTLHWSNRAIFSAYCTESSAYCTELRTSHPILNVIFTFAPLGVVLKMYEDTRWHKVF